MTALWELVKPKPLPPLTIRIGKVETCEKAKTSCPQRAWPSLRSAFAFAMYRPH
jgi:hypothetical protein